MRHQIYPTRFNSILIAPKQDTPDRTIIHKIDTYINIDIDKHLETQTEWTAALNLSVKISNFALIPDDIVCFRMDVTECIY